MTSAARPPLPKGSSRRHDLDWIRVAAFGLLILYHVGLVYGPYDWHIQSVHTFEWMREAVLITNPWRLTLLFLVSGSALRFMSLRRSPREVLRQRFARLGPPLIFGLLVLVSIQSWIEAMDKGSWTGGYLAWLWREYSPAGLADGVPFNHLWFVIYIAVYSLFAVWLMTRPDWIEAAGDWLERNLAGVRLLLIPIAYLMLIRIVLFPFFGLTNGLWFDWYNHFLSLGAFLFGFLIVGRESIWKNLERFRWVGVAMAICALPLMMLQVAHPGGGTWFGIPRNIVVAIDQWAVLSAILGFGSRHLRTRGGPTLRYLTDAVFTCYLAHQTILVVAVWLIRPSDLPAWIEAPMLAVVTLGGSLLIYEIVRHIPLIRPIWGLKPSDPPTPEPPPIAPNTARFIRRRRLLSLGVAAPLFALATVLLAVVLYPGFDHARQYLSELGGATASAPLVFNAGVLIAGLMAAVAGIGFALALIALNGARLAGVFTATAFVLAGSGLVLSSLFPWPDPRHMFINLGLGIQIAPVLLLWGLWGRSGLLRLKVFLAVVFLVMAALTVVTHHMVFPGTVNDGNVGLWERAYAIVLVGWVGVTAFVLERRLHGEGHPRGPETIDPLGL